MFTELYHYQTTTQQMLLNGGVYGKELQGKEFKGLARPLPADSPDIFRYHLLHLVTEVGEVAQADPRWKSLQGGVYDPNQKLEELADCFIELMNVAIFSGIPAEMMEHAISSKMETVRRRAVWCEDGKEDG